MSRASATKAPSAIIKDATALDARKQPNLHIVRPPAEGQGEEERILPLDCIGVSPYQPRRVFDPDALQRLADSLKARQLQPIVVRPIGDVPAPGSNGNGKSREAKLRYELIDGERRWRASKLAQLPGVRAMIVHCTDAQACEWAGIANLEREDLNAIERAHWMRSMLDVAGYTQQKLADRLQATQGHISNMVRLLELPDAFQQRVISGEMPATWARHLCAWTHRPTVMAALMASKVKPHNEDHLCRLINSAVEECTRPLSGNFHDTDGVWRDVAFKATPAQLQELDLIEVKDRWWNGKHKRCFNLTLWAKLQAAGAARKAEREAKRAEKAGKAVGFNGDGRGGKVAAALARERAKEQAEQFAKRLYRWKISWLQGLLVEKLAALPGADADAMILRLLMHFTMQDTNQREAGELRKAITNAGGTAKVSAGYAQTVRAIPSLLTVPAAKLRSAALDLLRKWLAMPTDAYRAHLHSTDIEALADALGIVVKRDWKLSDAYLQLHTTAQLLSLCSEWRFPRENVRGLKRTELIAFILRNNPLACPDEVLKLRRPAGV